MSTPEPVSVRAIPGMGGKVFDFRGTGLCPPALGGKTIRPLVMVHHIPVVHQEVGIGDFRTLAAILVGAGKSIQASTDGEGNVALFTHWHQLCWGQKGANFVGCGVEHMHFSTDKTFSENQMRAAAWCANQVWLKHNIPPHRGILLPGDGVVKVERKGHTSHMNVSRKAGFNNRTDPGPNFEYGHLYELTKFYREHKRF
jgi:N-acetylmuramoyl-L-alanine amidase